METMSEHEKYYKTLDKNLRDSLLNCLALGSIIGFLCGLVAASLLHKYIVHPLGW